MSRAKHWCFTLNNYSDSDVNFLANSFARDEKGITYLCYGREVGEQGTPHLQGFISFGVKRGLAYVRSCFTGGPHLEVARGTAHEAITYCEKDGDFTEFGVRPGVKGARSDLVAIQEYIRGGASIKDVADNHFGTYCRYKKAFEGYVAMCSVPRSEPPDVRVLWGETGCGKTRDAYAGLEETEVYSHPGGQWFDKFEGQQRAVFDDFGGSEFKLTYLLKLLDRYPMMVQIKGGHVNWNPREIVMTSNYHPKEWFPQAKEEHVKALLRRIGNIVHYSDPFHLRRAANEPVETEHPVTE